MRYTVEISLEGSTWLADVIDLPGAHTFSQSLVTLDHHVREAVALVLDLDEAAASELEIEYLYDKVPAVVRVAAELGAERLANDALVRRLQVQTGERARELTEAGYSVRDIAGLLHMSPGRVSQIVNQRLSA